MTGSRSKQESSVLQAKQHTHGPAHTLLMLPPERGEPASTGPPLRDRGRGTLRGCEKAPGHWGSWDRRPIRASTKSTLPKSFIATCAGMVHPLLTSGSCHHPRLCLQVCQRAEEWGSWGTTRDTEPGYQAWVSHYAVTSRWLSSAPPLAQTVSAAEAAQLAPPRRP